VPIRESLPLLEPVPGPAEGEILPPHARRSLALLGLSRGLRSFAAGFLNLAFPYLLLEDLHQGVFLLGLLYTGGALATAGLVFVLGRVGTRVALRGTYLASLVPLPVASLLLALHPSLMLVGVAAVLGGFSATGSLAGGGVGGMAQPFQTAILSSLVERTARTRMFSLFAFLNGFLAAVGALTVAFFPFATLFWLGTVLASAGVLLAIPVEVVPRPRGGRPDLDSRRVIRKFSITGILNGVSQGLITPFLVPFFVLVYDFPRTDMSFYSTASGLVATFALLLAPALERRWGFVPSLSYTRGLAGALALVFAFVRLLPLSLAIFVVLPALRVMALPTQTSAMVGMVPASDRAEVAGTNQATRVGSASGATAFSGWALANLSIEVPFVGYAAAVFANIYLYIHFFGWRRQVAGVPGWGD